MQMLENLKDDKSIGSVCAVYDLSEKLVIEKMDNQLSFSDEEE